MEDNSSTDDEIKDSLNSDLGGKKLKLNDGSSQDSLKDSCSSNIGEKDENVDSGISADKSESTSSDDRAVNASLGPSNEVVNVASSSSNVHAILLNIRRPIRTRNYRKRKTPGRDSDSNESSRDSDDLSPEESPQHSRLDENSHSDAESDEMQRIIATFSDGSPVETDAEDGTSESNDTSDSDNMVRLGDTDSDDELWSRSNEDNDENIENKGKPPSVLLKTRPKHNYLMPREIINREMGLTFPCGKTANNYVMFEQKFYGSLHVIYRLQKLHQLNKHRGCVNSINFHPEGHLLASGSDDTNVVIWDWSRNLPLQTVKTGHKSNVFQSKFLYLNARSQLNVVTCARDGQVRLIQCPPSGGASATKRRLATHARAAHKLHVSAAEPHVVISAGEDGVVMQCDVRAEHASRLFQVKNQLLVIPLYSVHGHPVETRELVVAGRDKFVRVYDRRRAAKPVAMYCPGNFNNSPPPAKKKVKARRSMHLTCAVYNHDGTEILGSYNDEDIYLFDTKSDIYDKDNLSDTKEGFSHRYTGHRNSATFKGVSFFGPKSQYVVSGSDCSYIYIWEKNSEAIVQWLHGDDHGVVNCIETHPTFPVLATSGLDRDVKIWIPKGHRDPTYDGLERVVRDNNVSLRSPLFNDFLPTLYSAWRGENRLFTDDDGAPNYGGNIEFEGNMCTTF